MRMDEILTQMGGLESIARELGVSESEAARGAQALAPALLGGFKKQAQQRPGGLAGLGDLLGQLGGSDLLANVLGPQPTDVARGNDVLGEIFGSKEVSRTVARDAASKTGLEPGLLKRMLPMLAMMVAGYMSQQGVGGAAAAAPRGGGGLGGLLGGLLGGSGPAASRTRAGGGGGLAAMLDFDGDGNPLDDILGMIGGRKG